MYTDIKKKPVVENIHCSCKEVQILRSLKSAVTAQRLPGGHNVWPGGARLIRDVFSLE